MTAPPGRPLRADARRNRERVLRAAADAFAADGLSVPVHEIARRAGVGTGTVSRHFPTKEDLFAAILLDRVASIVAGLDDRPDDPGAAFFDLFAALVRDGYRHRGLAEALAGAGYDLEAAMVDAGYDINERLRDLLRRAQHAGTLRPDVGFADIKALMTGCLARGGTEAERDRLIDIVRAGLRTN